eukprot:m.156014 g.156014  ORF g.156014 m.156014 type:complete len:89 (+) comp38685_c0_seq11:249-515(+)
MTFQTRLRRSVKGNQTGVPISGGRRPDIFESFDWTHGVFVGSAIRSMTTATSLEGIVEGVQHDCFAMLRPFSSYNFGHYRLHSALAGY